MNQSKITIVQLIQSLSFCTVESLNCRYENSNFIIHSTSLALVTNPPSNMPTGEKIITEHLVIGSRGCLTEFDIEPVANVRGWYFVVCRFYAQ